MRAECGHASERRKRESAHQMMRVRKRERRKKMRGREGDSVRESPCWA